MRVPTGFQSHWSAIADAGRNPDSGGDRRFALTRQDHDQPVALADALADLAGEPA